MGSAASSSLHHGPMPLMPASYSARARHTVPFAVLQTTYQLGFYDRRRTQSQHPPTHVHDPGRGDEPRPPAPTARVAMLQAQCHLGA